MVRGAVVSLEEQFISACEDGRLNLVKDILGRESRANAPAVQIVPEAQNYLGIRRAVMNGHSDVVRFFLEQLNVQERHALLNERFGWFGDTLIVLAFDRHRYEVVQLLQAYGAILPVNLQGYYDALLQERLRNPQKLYDNTATVDDSLARSAIALVARYLNLSEANKAILSAWATAKPNAEDESTKKQAMMEAMASDAVQDVLEGFVEGMRPEILLWRQELAASEDFKSQTASRALDSVFNSVQCRESRTRLTLVQVLSLVWFGVDYTLMSGSIRDDRRASFVQQLYEAQRQCNLNANGKDDPSEPDRPACHGGMFNLIVSTLVGQHPDVNILFVNKMSVQLKAQALLSELFNPADYTQEDLASMCQSFLVDCMYKIPQGAHEILSDKIAELLNAEFDEFIQGGFLDKWDIEEAAKLAPNLPSERAVKKIQDALEAYHMGLGVKPSRPVLSFFKAGRERPTHKAASPVSFRAYK